MSEPVAERIGVARYAPAAVFATVTVALTPPVLADALIPVRGVAGALATLALAVVLSLLLASAESLAWKRLHGARGIVFSDLMLWSFARRVWAERRLREIGVAYRAAAERGTARVEPLCGLSRLLEMRTPYTYGHCRRVARHAERIARAMKLSAGEVAEVRTAALIHDVGKIYTPSWILHKPGALTDSEFAVIKRHAVDGADMLAPVRDRRLAAIVRHHHERADGSGYPVGLCGTAIPLGARIIAVADTFDAITSHRPYRRARSQQEGLDVLAAEAGSRLDAEAVAAFLAIYTPRRSVASIAFSGAVWTRLAPTGLPGGLLGGPSLAGVLPAIGAAALLAVAPPARYGKDPSAATPPPAALESALPGALPTARAALPDRAPRFPRPSAGPPPAPSTPRSGAHHVHRDAPVAPAAGAAATALAPGGSGSSPRWPSGPLEGRLSSVEVHEPAASVPALSAPAASAPPVPAPVETTPASAVPPVALPGVTVAPAAGPGVSVGAAGVSLGATTVPAPAGH